MGWRNTVIVVACIILVPIMFAANAIAARRFGHEFPPLALAFWRWAFAFVMMAALCRGRLWRARHEVLADWPWYLLTGFLAQVLCGPTVYIAGRTTNAMNISLIYCASPVIIVVVERLFWRVPVTLRQVCGTVLCLLGVLMVLAKGQIETLLRVEFVPGDLWVVLAMLSWTVYSLILRRRRTTLDVATRLTAIILFGVVAMIPFYGWEVWSGVATPFDLRAVALYVFLAAVPGIGAFLGYNKLVALIGPGGAALTVYLVPLAAVFLSLMLLAEPPHLYHLLSIIAILPGMYYATVPKGSLMRRPERA